MTTRDFSIPGASCTVWHDGPIWQGAPAATIGRLRIEDQAAGAALLELVMAELADAGHAAVLAPMDGDTWHNYRAVLESDGSPPFALEPVSGAHDLAVLRGAGFEVIEEYASARAPVPAPGLPSPDVAGVTVTAWDGEGRDQLLGQLHAYAAGSFSDKLFFKSLDEDSFRALYEPLLARLDPRLVFFAHDDTGMAGFLFGYPDFAQGPQPSQAILKTYAATRKGVGRLLAWHFHERARDLGFSHVVHALMHSENISLKSSKLFEGEIFRRYGVLAKRLSP